MADNNTTKNAPNTNSNTNGAARQMDLPKRIEIFLRHQKNAPTSTRPIIDLREGIMIATYNPKPDE